ncbi:type II toxin-antitoxin system VapC family toxin [Picosynechococcus sp. PCC 73109]|uniref:type II toxin-antitoxin system VapC family toxin n=1 Tax=Picosynechococcus sp. PCC 73109 TaxID=374982 RepID=UPI00074594FF|nr:PIN domain-containing protein [Picosynechococcus sp. PCC 73109]AMA10665.1 twitching motility protein PilT [Picosynechococcus sp. PCC 73109]
MDRRLIADTSGIIAFLDRDDDSHLAVVEIIQNHQVFIPATILPEVDYLATKYLGEKVSRVFLEDLQDGYFTYLPATLDDITNATKIMTQYKDFPLGLVDASLVVLAERYQITRILTLDRRHFNTIKTETIPYIELLP